MQVTPVVLCGGSGTRLWPLSRETYPKQFVDLGEGHTLFKETLHRALACPHSTAPLIVCNETHRFYAGAALKECGMQGRILLEPAPRNTAPAIALAALALTCAAHSQTDDAGDAQNNETDNDLMLVMPSDHRLPDHTAFAQAAETACRLARSGAIVTFGIAPTGPETGFGYIQQGLPLPEGGFSVARFVEKPTLDRASAMLQQGGYSWNSGMFLFRASVYLQELQRVAPAMLDCCRKAWSARTHDGAFIRPGSAFLDSPADSIDYAVMEKTALAAVCPLNTLWNDLGSWEAFYQTGTKDADKNVCMGDVITSNASGCYLHADKRLLAAVDIQDMVVVETGDAILVAPRASSQHVKHIVEQLKSANRSECRISPVVFRPWGSYETLTRGPRFQVKRIIVNPGERLSLQLHHHRAEHWIVVEGTAEITNGEHTALFHENQSTYIPVETKHCLKNPGTQPLIIIEVQSGDYLGEDDIKRFDDLYGRETVSAE